jgi:hypothetical protein
MIKVAWRSVKDGLPEEDQECLVAALDERPECKADGYDIQIGWYSHESHYWHDAEWMEIEAEWYHVTHWAPFEIEPPEAAQ